MPRRATQVKHFRVDAVLKDEQRGEYVPHHYRQRQYYVNDWHAHQLYAPPYGYHWVRVGNDVLLTALATGVVLDVLYDIWY